MQKVMVLVMTLIATACSLDATILGENNITSGIDESRNIPGYVNGEVITTPSGYRVRGVFGDIVEGKELSNGWKVQAVFF